MGPFERGFKSWAERTAISIRSRLKIKPYDPLSPFDLAQLLEVKLLKPEDIIGLEPGHLAQLIRNDNGSWSAVTLCIGKKNILIYNSSHAPQRQSTDIMHELSHIIIGHKPTRFFVSPDPKIDIPIRDYDKKQEDEADWLSYCLLLPRIALEHIKKSEMSEAEVLQSYKVSSILLNMRMGLTGVNKQMNRFVKFNKRKRA